MVHHQWNDLDAAGVHLAELVDQRYLVRSLPVHQGMEALVRVRQARARAPRRGRCWRSSASFRWSRGREEDNVRSLRAGLMLEQGDGEGAFRWVDAFTAQYRTGR